MIPDNVTPESLRLRPALPADCRQIWRWATAPDVRQRSVQRKPIPYDVHIKWFNEKMNAEGTRLYVLVLDEVPVANIRFDRVSDGIAEVSLTVSDQHRGCGFGRFMLSKAMSSIYDELHVSRLLARIHDTNVASVRLFTRAGFVKSGEETIAGRVWGRYLRHAPATDAVEEGS